MRLSIKLDEKQRERLFNIIGIIVFSLLFSWIFSPVIKSNIGGYIDNNQVTTLADFHVTNDLVVDGRLKVGASPNSGAGYGADFASTVQPGCIVLGDSGSAVSSPVYITASGSSISATTSIPEICK